MCVKERERELVVLKARSTSWAISGQARGRENGNQRDTLITNALFGHIISVYGDH